LAICKPVRPLIAPRERMRELCGSWREAEKKRNSRRRKTLKRTTHGKRGSRAKNVVAVGDPLVVTPAEYDQYLLTVAENQAKLKQWADSAPCNFGHQYLLVEVRSLIN
jgi:hypothetical protein